MFVLSPTSVLDELPHPVEIPGLGFAVLSPPNSQLCLKKCQLCTVLLLSTL